ncbi:MAG: rod-binding protein [Thermodesulfobacteriota bacterium]
MKMAFDPQMAAPSGADKKNESAGSDNAAELKQVCQDFEAVFINTLFKEMRSTVPDEGYLGDGPGKEVFQEMMDSEVSRQVARQGGLGLGRQLYQQFQAKPGDAAQQSGLDTDKE